MPNITYVSADDATSTTVEGQVGASVMQTAVDHGVDGIVAECGGEMMCATCHVYVDEAWTAKTGGASSDDEDAMLDETVCDRQPTSRLSCQIKLTEELDGLVVHLPEAQT